jgi:hypothetical protein
VNANPVMYPLSSPDPLRVDFQRDRVVVVHHALPSSLIARWRYHALGLRRFAATVTRRESGFDLIYRVLTGDHIRVHWPELFAFYNNGDLLAWVKNVTGDSTTSLSQHIRSAVNLNILDTTDCRYRWHFDVMSYTVLLYLTDCAPQDGGALNLIPDCQKHIPPDLATARITQIWPRAGTIVVMDGTRCYHSVAPMLRKALRLSVPLVFPNSEASVRRPPGLDAYLYPRAA